MGPEHPAILTSRHNLAVTLYSQGQLDAARAHWEYILEASSRALGEGRATGTKFEVEVLSHLVEVYRDLDETPKAAEKSLASLEALERQTHRSGDAEELRSSFRQQYDQRYLTSLDLLLALNRTTDAFDVLQRYRARGLLHRLERRYLASGEISEELATKREILAREYDRTVHAAYASSLEEERVELRGRLEKLRREQQKVEAAIRASMPGGDPTVHLADAESARGALDPGSLLISYVVGPEEITVFTLTREGPLEVHREKVSYEKLGRQVLRLRGRLGNDPNTLFVDDSINRWLAQRLIAAPIRKRVDAAERLIIVPDRLLHYVPFATLVQDGADGAVQFLIEQKPLHLVASATVYGKLQRSRQRRGPPQDPVPGDQRLALAAFGNPSYPESLSANADDSASEASSTSSSTAARAVADAASRNLFAGLVPLPHSGREVEALETLYKSRGEVVAYTGLAASEANLKRDAPQARVVHIAAHGLADYERPFDSFLALTVNEQLDESESENGLLQSWELFDGDLRLDADLVVLSACQTALGDDLGGEGIVSLSRAFQVAGARTVAASLWTVADDSTAELMIRFHSYLLDGLSKDRALQEAQIDLIRGRPGPDGEPADPRYAAPYHWAAFQLFGDWQ